ncbi:DinB family protein [Rariglobus hedericola]|uniref:DinB family protein n=1 Tax=Rariglobus hedericola TaxID=2597822 RepID=A0A556QPA5_9BACT|nr:DinB family protein [Rariglobus hedericola]TSJ78480.1 DinB family protein [Rariglobus hedericola]
MITPSIRDNVAALRQGSELLAGLSAELYAQRTPACFNSSTGGHLRHVIEHYLSFLQGTETGEIDYEARARDPLIEKDPGYAAAQLEAIGERLERLEADRALRVRAECAPADTTTWGVSSVVRELEFLLSHTIHHYALIGVICQLGGQKLPKDFGMAPSTLRYLQSQAAACAH